MKDINEHAGMYLWLYRHLWQESGKSI